MATDDSESCEKKVINNMDDKPNEIPTGKPINSKTITNRKRISDSTMKLPR